MLLSSCSATCISGGDWWLRWWCFHLPWNLTTYIQTKNNINTHTHTHTTHVPPAGSRWGKLRASIHLVRGRRRPSWHRLSSDSPATTRNSTEKPSQKDVSNPSNYPLFLSSIDHFSLSLSLQSTSLSLSYANNQINVGRKEEVVDSNEELRKMKGSYI